MSGHEHAGFAMIPMWLVCDERVTPAALRVFAVLSGHVHEHGTWRLTHGEIQEDSGYKRTAVIDALNLLRELGVVEWDTPDLKDPDQALGCVYRIKVDRTGVDTPYSAPRTPHVRQNGHPVSAPAHTNIDSPQTPHIQEGDSVATLPIDVEAETPKRRRKSPEVPLPDDWKPKPRHDAFAREKGIDLPTEAMKFRNHAAAKDRRCVRWDAAFDNWLIGSLRFSPPLKVAGDEYDDYKWWQQS